VDVSEMQRKLSQWAQENPTEQRRDLYSLLCNKTWLRAAHHSVNTNEGRETAGIDGETMSNFNGNLDGNLEALREKLKTMTFEPVSVRRVYIPKAHGKTRPLGIPGIRDRIVQEALRMILEPIWEADFSERSYGFRPNRSTYDAISYISNRLSDYRGWTYQWVIEGDIASYFDTIPHRRLIKGIKKRVADRDIRNLIWKFLRAGVMEKGHYSDTLTGTPQGGILSPLLANIYLHELDKYMESNHLSYNADQRVRRRRKGLGNCLYVRYADDFIILHNGTKEQALAMKEELRTVLDQLGLKMSEEKTKITHITEGFTFLGYKNIREIGTRGKMVIKVHVPEKAIQRARFELNRIINPKSTNDSLAATITAANNFIRGWCQYYRCTSTPSRAFRVVQQTAYWNLVHWLGRKYDIRHAAQILRTYSVVNRSGRRSLGKEKVALILPTEYSAKKRLVKAWHNPYTAKEIIKRENLLVYERLWHGGERRHGNMDLREEVLLSKGPICNACKETCNPFELEMDHIKLRASFKDPKEADSMNNLQLLCTSCHRAKTESDLKVLSRMR
jgi:RNA-directed DNA polymerase